jgi:hypothetical protein
LFLDCEKGSNIEFATYFATSGATDRPHYGWNCEVTCDKTGLFKVMKT